MKVNIFFSCKCTFSLVDLLRGRYSCSSPAVLKFSMVWGQEDSLKHTDRLTIYLWRMFPRQLTKHHKWLFRLESKKKFTKRNPFTKTKSMPISVLKFASLKNCIFRYFDLQASVTRLGDFESSWVHIFL